MKDHLISFDDTKIAFEAKSDADLKRAYWLFKMISFNWLVKISPPFVNFALWAHLPVKGIIRATIFKHFCGGETINDCKGTIENLGKFNIGTILDYSVEGKESEKDFDDAVIETIATVSRAKNDPHIPFSVFKPTGFARFALLEKKNAGFEFTPSEKEEYKTFLNRIEKICQAGYDAGVPLFIDAEETWIQDVIDEVAREMMKKFNKERTIIYNTLQMYRTDRLTYLKESIAHAKENGYKPGFKIVRGAYMEKERARAEKMNYKSPIQPDKSSTDRDYNAALKICIDNIDMLSLICGTHNEQSSLYLVEWMNEKKIANNHPHIWFSQLYGMSDHISFNLASKGYNVCKYVPYGPVTAVLPYLIRRAQENTSVAGQTGRELSLILTEKKRRK
jgi:proline dehydrogenase